LRGSNHSAKSTGEAGGTKRVVKKPNPDVKLFIDWYAQQYRNRFGEKLDVNGKKDGALIKQKLGTFSLEKLKTLAGKFLLSQDPWTIERGFGIAIFCSQLNKLVSAGKDKWSYLQKEPEGYLGDIE